MRLTSRAALTTLSDDERLFRDSVYEFADREIRPLVREMDEQAQIPRALIDRLFELGVMGIEIPEDARRRRRHLLSRRARGRGAVAGRSVGRRARGRAEHARHQRPAALGQRRAEADATCPRLAQRTRRRLRAVGGRLRQRRVRADDAGRARRRRLGAHRPQALDHQRQRGRRSSSSSPPSIPRPATTASRRSSSSAGSAASPSARRRTSSASAPAAPAS